MNKGSFDHEMGYSQKLVCLYFTRVHKRKKAKKIPIYKYKWF